MKISLKPDKLSDCLAEDNSLKTNKNFSSSPNQPKQKPILYYSFLWLLIFLNLFEQMRTQSPNLNPKLVIITNATGVNGSVIPITQTTQNIPNVDFNPNIYFNSNYTKIQPYLIPETTSLLKDRACFQRLLPVMGYLSDYEQALLVRAALQNTDDSRCIDCNYYTSNLMNAIKKELANAVKLLNIESYTKRDPMRCMMNLVAMGEAASIQQSQNQNQPQVIVQNQNQSNLNINNTNNTNLIAANSTNVNISIQSNSTQNTMDNKNIVLQSLNRPTLGGAVQGPLSSQVAQEISDYLYYQAMGNQCAAEFLYESEMLLMERRRYFCARNDDMNNIAIFDSNNNIIAFKWTYKEAERMSDLFNNYAQCKSIENNIYPQVFNKAYGILASNRPCQVEADMIIAQRNATIQVVPASLVVNATTPVNTTVTNAVVQPITPAMTNQTVSVNVTSNPPRFLKEKLVYLEDHEPQNKNFNLPLLPKDSLSFLQTGNLIKSKKNSLSMKNRNLQAGSTVSNPVILVNPTYPSQNPNGGNNNPQNQNYGRGPTENKQEINQARPYEQGIVIPKHFADFAGSSPNATSQIPGSPLITNTTLYWSGLTPQTQTLPGPGAAVVGRTEDNQVIYQNQNQISYQPQNQTQAVTGVVPVAISQNATLPLVPNTTINQANAQQLIEQMREQTPAVQNQTITAISLPATGATGYTSYNEGLIQPIQPLSTNATAPFRQDNYTAGENKKGLSRDFLQTGPAGVTVPIVAVPIGIEGQNLTPLQPLNNNTTAPFREVNQPQQGGAVVGVIAAQAPNVSIQTNVPEIQANQTSPVLIKTTPQPIVQAIPIVTSAVQPEVQVPRTVNPTTNITVELTSNATQPLPAAPQPIPAPFIIQPPAPVPQPQPVASQPKNITVTISQNETQPLPQVAPAPAPFIIQAPSPRPQPQPIAPQSQNITVAISSNATQPLPQVAPAPAPFIIQPPAPVPQPQPIASQPQNIAVAISSNATQPLPQVAPAPAPFIIQAPSPRPQLQTVASQPQNIAVAISSNATQPVVQPAPRPQIVTVPAITTNPVVQPAAVTTTTVAQPAPQANVSVQPATNPNPIPTSFLQKLPKRHSFLQVTQRLTQNITIPANASEGILSVSLNQTTRVPIFENKSLLFLPVDFENNDSDIKQSVQNLLNFLSERRTENVNLIYANLLNPVIPASNAAIATNPTGQNVTVIVKPPNTNPRMLFLTNQQIRNDIITNRRYYNIYDDLTSKINNTILVSNKQDDFRNTYCVNSMDNILYYIKENFAENQITRNKNNDKFFDKLMSLWFDTQSEIFDNKCANDFLIVSQYDLLSGNKDNLGNNYFENSTNINFADLVNVQPNQNNIVSYCVNCPSRFKNYNLILAPNTNANLNGKYSGNFSANNLNVGVFNLQAEDNLLLANNTASSAQSANSNGNTRPSAKKIGFFYLSFGCLNQEPFGFGILKNTPSSQADINNMDSLLSYTYGNVTLDSRCMSRTIECLNKGTDNKNLTFCASDYLSPTCSRIANLNTICVNQPFNYRFLRALQQNTNVAANTPNVNITIQNATLVTNSNATSTVTPATGVYNIPVRFNNILNNLASTNLYNGNQNILFIPFFCDLKNYISGKPLFKSYNELFNKLISQVISSIKIKTDMLNLVSNNQAIHDLIQNYNYDFMKIDMSNSSFYDLYLKQSYSSNQLNNIFEPVVNLNVSQFLDFTKTTTAADFEPKFRAYLELVRDNATNIAKDNYINNCFTWAQNNFLRNSINLNALNFANYSNIVIQSNLEMSNSKNAKMRFLQQAQDTSFKIMDNDPTATDPVLSNFRQNIESAFNNETGKVKIILRVDGSTVDAPANYTDIASNIGSSQYFSNLNYLNETDQFGNMSQNFNDNLIAFYNSRNQTIPPDAIIILSGNPQNQTAVNIGAKYIKTGFLLVFALLFFVLI